MPGPRDVRVTPIGGLRKVHNVRLTWEIPHEDAIATHISYVLVRRCCRLASKQHSTCAAQNEISRVAAVELEAAAFFYFLRLKT